MRSRTQSTGSAVTLDSSFELFLLWLLLDGQKVLFLLPLLEKARHRTNSRISDSHNRVGQCQWMT